MFKAFFSKVKGFGRKLGLKKRILLAAVVIIVTLPIGAILFINKAFDLIIISQLSEMELNIGEDPGTYTVQQDTRTENGAAADNGALSGESPENPVRERQSGSTENNGTAEAFPKLTESSSEKSGSETPEQAGDKAEPGKTVMITPEKISEVQKKVSVSDKARALEIVLTKLKPEDVAVLKEMAKGGITGAEMTRARKVIKSRVTGEEKDKLKKLFYKYLYLIEND